MLIQNKLLNLSSTLQLQSGVEFADACSILNLSAESLSELCKSVFISETTSKRSSRPPIPQDFILNPEQMRFLLQKKGLKYPGTAQRIALMMCKGGVGKTTVTFYLAQRLAQYGARVLVIDADPQANLTSALLQLHPAFSVTESTPVLVDIFSQQCTINQAILGLTDNLHLIPSTGLNSLLEKRLLSQKNNAVTGLHKKLLLLDKDYDFILIDSAPALNLINASIMYASERILLPLLMSEFSIMGLEQTLNEIQDLQKAFRFSSQVQVLINRLNEAEPLSFGYLGKLAEKYRKLVMKTVVRYSPEIQSSVSTGKSIFSSLENNGLMNGRIDFDHLTREILNFEVPTHA